MAVPSSYLPPERELILNICGKIEFLWFRTWRKFYNSNFTLSVSEGYAAPKHVPRAVSNVTLQSGIPILKTFKVPFSENRFPELSLPSWMISRRITCGSGTSPPVSSSLKMWFSGGCMKISASRKTFSSSKIVVVRCPLHLGRKYYKT